MKNHSTRNHLIDLDDFTVAQWNEIIRLAGEIMENPHIYEGSCKGKIMATLFYEPSTRTQMSFQSAMLRLGGGIIGFDNPKTSSVIKGENLKDTTKIVSGYSDIMVMRHYLEGAVKAAALTAECPVVNAGDGGHLHPTQTLTDLLTLKKEKGRLENLKIGVCGDLKNGRTVHSLIKALSSYEGNKFTLISTRNLELPRYMKEYVDKKGVKYEEYNSLDQAIGDLDVLYMTRIQKERFDSEEEYNRESENFILDGEKMKKASPELIVMHPLPRVNEIAVEVDDDPRAVYFKQASYGMYVRMALILILLNYKLETKPLIKGEIREDLFCENKKCITETELYLPRSFYKAVGGESLECEYCEHRHNRL